MDLFRDLWNQVAVLPIRELPQNALPPDLAPHIKEALKPFGEPPDTARYGGRVAEALEVALYKYQLDKGVQYPGLLAVVMNSYLTKASAALPQRGR